MQSLALYIHWPFCKAKCPYCDFNSHVRTEVDHSVWTKALLAELRHMAQWMPDATLGSIFFGGGTPSLMHPQTVEALIERATKYWPADAGIEITLEANPTSVEAKKFRDFRAAGVNRVSLGVQSLRDESLAFLGREHSATEALKAVALAAETFDRYSFDLIYARPEQTTSEWESELRAALQHADKHLSLYQLTIEENTAFHHAYHHKGMFNLPPEEQAAELYELTQFIMEDAGLPAYEISNHAAAGEASRHNMAYWQGDAYLGVGPGAHGRAVIDGVWHATSTLKSPERWLERTQTDGHAIEVCAALSEQERAEEYLMMGLRTTTGVDLTRLSVSEILNQSQLPHLAREGLITMQGNHLQATQKGWLVLNQLIVALVA